MPDEGTAREITIIEIENLIGDLRHIAISLLNLESNAHSVRPTALIHTALRRSKLKDQTWEDIRWDNREQFMRSMHWIMRKALVDYARRRNAVRRPKIDYVAPQDLDLYDLADTAQQHPDQMIALEEALDDLANEESELSYIIQLHYFSGLNVSELARIMELSDKTIKRRLKRARLILHRMISKKLEEGVEAES